MKKWKRRHPFTLPTAAERACFQWKLNARARNKMIYSRKEKRWILVREDRREEYLNGMEAPPASMRF